MLSRKFAAEDLSPAVWMHLSDILVPYRNLYHEKLLKSSLENLTGKQEEISCIQKYYKEIEEPSWMASHHDIDEYMSAVYEKYRQMVNSNDQTHIVQECIEQELNKIVSIGSGVVLLWITREEKPYFHVIIQIEECEIVLVTTADRYNVDTSTLQECYDKIKAEFKDQIVIYDFTYEEWLSHLHYEKKSD